MMNAKKCQLNLRKCLNYAHCFSVFKVAITYRVITIEKLVLLCRNKPHYFDKNLDSFILYDVDAQNLLANQRRRQKRSASLFLPIEMDNEGEMSMQVTFRTTDVNSATLMVVQHELQYEFVHLEVSKQ